MKKPLRSELQVGIHLSYYDSVSTYINILDLKDKVTGILSKFWTAETTSEHDYESGPDLDEEELGELLAREAERQLP